MISQSLKTQLAQLAVFPEKFTTPAQLAAELRRLAALADEEEATGVTSL